MKQKKTFCFTGMSSSGNYKCYNNTIDAMEKAVKERVLLINVDGVWVEPFRPCIKEFNSRTKSFTSKFKKGVCYATPMKPRAFAETYQGRKRTLLLKAVEANETLGFTDDCSIIRAFMKHEPYLFGATKIPIPRLIQPRDYRYIVETGRYIKPIEKLLYKNINRIYGDTTVFKGLNMEQRGNALFAKWSRFKNPVAVPLDASKFDKHVSNSALRWEHGMYQSYYPGDRYFKHILSLQRCNKGRGYTSDGSLVYSTTHNRASGDSNTSSGNVLIMCGLTFDYLEYVELDADLANDGDDCVLFLEKENLNKLNLINQWFECAGFVLVTEAPVSVFERIEFCQAQPVFNQYGGYTMVRNPRKSVGKDAVAKKPLDNRSIMQKWMAAVGDGGMALTAGMPVLQEYYSFYKRNSNGADPLVDTTMDGGFFRLSKGMNATYREPSPETRYSFWLAFDITPTEQVVLEEYYRKLTLGVGTVENRFNVIPI